VKKHLVILFAVLASALAACSSPPPGSCTATAGMATYCISYTGSSASASAIQQGCSMSMGTYQTTDCASANRVGRCTLPGGNATLTQTANFYPPMTAADAMTACTALMGTFAAN
jgi:hypothetical protein